MKKKIFNISPTSLQWVKGTRMFAVLIGPAGFDKYAWMMPGHHLQGTITSPALCPSCVISCSERVKLNSLENISGIQHSKMHLLVYRARLEVQAHNAWLMIVICSFTYHLKGELFLVSFELYMLMCAGFLKSGGSGFYADKSMDLAPVVRASFACSL